MKNSVSFTLLGVIILLSSCMQTRYITEQYIKTSIENHTIGEFSTIKTYSIFKGTSFDGGSYLEFTGYKCTNAKALVIGADKYYVSRQKFKDDQTMVAKIAYIELSMAQCAEIINNYSILLNKMKAEKPKLNEEIYHDYTVSKDLFISYNKANVNSSVSFMDFWIYGEKYRISTANVMKQLEKFMKY